MNRRGFLSFLGSAAAVAAVDPMELIWTPKKTIFIPPARYYGYILEMNEAAGMTAYWHGRQPMAAIQLVDAGPEVWPLPPVELEERVYPSIMPAGPFPDGKPEPGDLVAMVNGVYRYVEFEGEPSDGDLVWRQPYEWKVTTKHPSNHKTALLSGIVVRPEES